MPSTSSSSLADGLSNRRLIFWTLVTSFGDPFALGVGRFYLGPASFPVQLPFSDLMGGRTFAWRALFLWVAAAALGCVWRTTVSYLSLRRRSPVATWTQALWNAVLPRASLCLVMLLFSLAYWPVVNSSAATELVKAMAGGKLASALPVAAKFLPRLTGPQIAFAIHLTIFAPATLLSKDQWNPSRLRQWLLFVVVAVGLVLAFVRLRTPVIRSVTRDNRFRVYGLTACVLDVALIFLFSKPAAAETDANANDKKTK